MAFENIRRLSCAWACARRFFCEKTHAWEYKRAESGYGHGTDREKMSHSVAGAIAIASVNPRTPHLVGHNQDFVEVAGEEEVDALHNLVPRGLAQRDDPTISLAVRGKPRRKDGTEARGLYLNEDERRLQNEHT